MTRQEQIIDLFVNAIKNHDDELYGLLGVRFCRNCGRPFVIGVIGRHPNTRHCSNHCAAIYRRNVAQQRKQARANVLEYRAELQALPEEEGT